MRFGSVTMLSHKQIWSAIDALAARYGHSPSGLARAAGLDPTTFNKSKRLGPQGRLRWPSTESLSKILQVTGASLEDFVALLSRGGDARGAVADGAVSEAQGCGQEERVRREGRPSARPGISFAFPDLNDDTAFALEVSSDGGGARVSQRRRGRRVAGGRTAARRPRAW